VQNNSTVFIVIRFTKLCKLTGTAYFPGCMNNIHTYKYIQLTMFENSLTIFTNVYPMNQ